MALSSGIFINFFKGLRLSIGVLAFGAASLILTESAGAQSAICRQIESELASLGRGGGGGGQYARQAAQARARLGAIQERMAGLGCNRGGFLFGPQPPAECGSLRAQANAAAASVAQYSAASQQAGGGGARRAQLLAALDANNCRAPQRQRMDMAVAQPAPQPARPRGFFDMLFGGGNSQPAYATETVPAEPPPLTDAERKRLEEEKRKPKLGGNMPICVRTCDGFFFPVNYQGAGEGDQYEEVCRASCPNASTELFYMRAGADLDTAVSEEGKAYTALPAAFRYRQAYDPTCSCKKQDESWAMALRQADQLIRDRRTDITVTQERSDEMARPLPARELRGVRGRQAAAKAPDPEVRQSIDGANSRAILPSDAGETRESSRPDGETRNIRVLTPNISID